MSNERETSSITLKLCNDMRPLPSNDLDNVVGGFVIYGLGGPDTRVATLAAAIIASSQDNEF